MSAFKRLLFELYVLPRVIYHPTKVGVRLLLVKDEQVLLVRHTYQDGWFMPGGGVKRGETLNQAALREAREEAGVEVKNLHLLGTYTNFSENMNNHITTFWCDDFSMTGQHDFEIAEIRFFPLDSLPEDMQPGQRRRIEEYKRDPHQGYFGYW
jgi:ADP-ribose pyrophosphatase YjhB (NUDIX family)